MVEHAHRVYLISLVRFEVSLASFVGSEDLERRFLCFPCASEKWVGNDGRPASIKAKMYWSERS